MRISDLFTAQQTGSTESIAQKRKEEEQEPFVPLSWGGDTVTFSAEARIMQQSSSAAKEDKAEEDTSGKEAAATLSEVIKKATGGVSTTSPAEQIEALEKKLKELQTRLAQVAASSMPEESKEGMMAAINGEISQVAAQIGELKAEANKQQA